MTVHRLYNFACFLGFIAILAAAGKVYADTQSGQDVVNFAEIRQYAKLSRAAYQPESSVRDTGLLKNYRLTHYGNIPEVGITYFLVSDDASKSHIISVRGTSNLENAIVDVSLKLALDKHVGVRLHNGFSQVAAMIYKKLRPLIKTDYTVNTTGHSLGGAVAMILAMYLDVDKYDIGNIITFGQPKVTNITGARKFKHLNIIRVVTPKDVVPLVPPVDLLDLNDIDIYWHAGKEVVLLPGDTYAVLRGQSSMMRATKFTQMPLDESNLHDHQMSLYLKMVDQKIATARQVPYKNDFNLFNLFGNGKQ